MALVPTTGELRDSVRFERMGKKGNVGGVVKSDWISTGIVRSARIVSRTGGEGVLAARQTGAQPVEITVRYDSETRTITTDDRAVDKHDATRIWAIRSISEIGGGQNRWLNLLCEAGGTDGR